jgi:fumarylacetoacetate (FAA) hydrolase
MKLVLFRPRDRGGAPRPGLVHGARVLEPAVLLGADPAHFPHDPVTLLASNLAADCRTLLARLRDDAPPGPGIHDLAGVELLPPVLRPGTFRDFYSFEEHVRQARARRGLAVPPEWYRAPVFYFSNPNAIYGPGQDVPRPRSTRKLDCEVEIGCIIGRAGRDIPSEQATAYIAGFTLLNDWSARDLQAEEVKVGLGPSKGKDFATSLGPWLVTPDELASQRSGKGYDLVLEWRRNGRLLGTGNWDSIAWSFEEMIAHASRDTALFPGDLIGSGTVGGGCILEIGDEKAGGWLEPGDVVALQGGRLGTLENRIAGAGAGADATPASGAN